MRLTRRMKGRLESLCALTQAGLSNLLELLAFKRYIYTARQ